jgi:hypothetical protein
MRKTKSECSSSVAIDDATFDRGRTRSLSRFDGSGARSSVGGPLELVSEPDRAVRRDASLARRAFEDGLDARRERSTPQGDADLKHSDGRF